MPRKSTDERRQEIIQGLLEAMSEHGYAKASIKKIADAAGITPGLIHYHFDSKQAILLALVDELVPPQVAALEELARTADSPTAALMAMIDHLLAMGDAAQPDAVAAWVSVGAEAIREPDIAAAYSESLARLLGLFSDVITDGQQAGEFSTGDLNAHACAAALVAIMEGYFTIAASAREHIPPGSAAPATRRMARGLLDLPAE